MTKEERLTELARLINKLRNECLMGDRYLPIGDVRRYNELVHSLYGDELGEDPEIEEAISKMENATRWISAKDQTPERNGVYLCLFKAKGRGGVAIDKGMGILQFINGEWSMHDGFAVTHWVHIPAPPKEGER